MKGPPKGKSMNPKGRGKNSKVIVPAHRKIFELYKEQGFRSLAKAIRRTGVYSESLAKRPGVLTNTKSWQLLMQEYLPEETLALRHAELLDKRQTEVVEDLVYNKEGKLVKKVGRLVDMGPETNAVSKGLELAYRLRGSFSKDDTPPPSTVMYNLIYKPEIREQMRVFEAGIKNILLNEINKRNLEEDAAEASARATAQDGVPIDGGGAGEATGGGESAGGGAAVG